jgi:hypothetical protein
VKACYFPIALSILLSLLVGCSGDQQSPEEAVRALIETAADTAEQRNTGGLLELVDDNYRDRKGQNKKQVAGLLRAYFFTHKDIHLFTRIKSIDWLGEEQAKVTLYVAMAGSVISNIEALESLRARVYRFELALVRHDDDSWLLQSADWAPANLFDMQ